QQFFINNRKNTCQHCRDNPENNARLVLGIKIEDKIDASHNQQSEQYFHPVNSPSYNQWFKKGSEKTYGGEASHGNRNIRIFNASIKANPMQRNNNPHTKKLQCIF